jgi:hypothetical protein
LRRREGPFTLSMICTVVAVWRLTFMKSSMKSQGGAQSKSARIPGTKHDIEHPTIEFVDNTIVRQLRTAIKV